MMIGSESFGTTMPNVLQLKTVKSKILTQIEEDKCSSELSEQLKCLTLRKVRSKSRGGASGEEIRIVQRVEIFWKDGIPPRLSPRLLLFVKLSLLLPGCRLLL